MSTRPRRVPAEEDVAPCQANLAIHAGRPELAEEFLERWQRETGRSADYDPYWDLVNMVSCTSVEPDPAMDEFVAQAAARC